MNYLVRDREVIFNLAGQVSHIDSMRDPVHGSRDQLPQPADDSRGVPLQQSRRQGGVRRHAAGLRPARLAAGRREASRAADRRQRHQQGGRRVLPSRLQQRVRRPRLLAAADQRLRAAAADPPQPPGLHRLVHPAGDRRPRRSRSTATARSCAISSTSTMPPTRSCGRARSTRATARCSTSAATSRSATATLTALLVEIAGTRPRRVRRLAGREEGDRHRRLLRRLDEVQARHRLGRRSWRSREGLRRDDRVLPPALSTATSIRRSRRRSACDAAARARSCRWRRARTPPRCAPPSTASSRAAGSSSAPRSRRSSASSPRRAARARGRRRHRHRRDRADPPGARHRTPATKSSRRRCRRPTRALAIMMAGARPCSPTSIRRG